MADEIDNLAAEMHRRKAKIQEAIAIIWTSIDWAKSRQGADYWSSVVDALESQL